MTCSEGSVRQIGVYKGSGVDKKLDEIGVVFKG